MSLVVIAVGLASAAALRHRRATHKTTAAPPTAIYTAPPIVPVTPTPEGEIAWEPNARAPVLTSVNGDSVEDVFGFFRVWDGRSAWVAHAGAFDGATLKPLWRSEPIDPQILKQPGVFDVAVVAGTRVVVADTSATLRVYDVASGEKRLTLKLGGPVNDLCRSPDRASRVWVGVDTGADTALDLDTGKAEAAPRPKWCPLPAFQRTEVPRLSRHPPPDEVAAMARKKADATACDGVWINGILAEARCAAPAASPLDPDFRSGYELTDGTLTVALGTKGERPFAMSRTKGAPWSRGFVTDDTLAKPAAPAVADLARGRLYAVYERVYFDARLAAVDAKTGETLWDVPIVGSLGGHDGPGRGEARALLSTTQRVYVVRTAGGLDVFDAASGKALGTVGRQ
jgi:outer membrane protein assembly factor BamB